MAGVQFDEGVGDFVESVTVPRKKPGPKPGQPHSGQFKSGHDPRRWTKGPRPNKAKQDLQLKMQEHTEEAVEELMGLLRDPKTPARDKKGLLELVFSYGHGTPVNRIMMAQIGNGGAESLTNMPKDAMDALAAQILAERALERGEVSDIRNEDEPCVLEAQ